MGQPFGFDACYLPASHGHHHAKRPLLLRWYTHHRSQWCRPSWQSSV